jgi:hypothetical protein
MNDWQHSGTGTADIGASSLRAHFAHSQDVHIREIDLTPDTDAVLVYCEGLCSAEDIDRYVLPELRHWPLPASSPERPGAVPMLIRQDKLPLDLSWSEIEQRIFGGELLLLLRNEERMQLISFQIDDSPKRSTEESNAEISVIGPRDGFVEDLRTNVALVRKRLKSTSLRFEPFTIGERSRTKVLLLYVQDAIAPDLPRKVRDKISSISVENLQSANQLEDLLGRQPFSIFPQFHYTGRPDFAVDCMLRGRFVLLVEGSPVAVIGPANLLLLLKSPEDDHLPFLMTSFGRILRYIGLVISIFLPGFWTSLAVYNQDQLPFPLLATVTVSRLGTPLSASAEMMLMMIIMELFREAGVRLPKTISPTVTVVGGIIIGEASIQAGILSPTIIIVASITAVCSSTLVNQMLSGISTILRLGVFFLAAVLGFYGFIVGLFAVILYLASLDSFGYPYVAPLSPLRWRQFGRSFLKLPGKWAYAQTRSAAGTSAEERRQRP